MYYIYISMISMVLNCAGSPGNHPNMRTNVLVFAGLAGQLATIRAKPKSEFGVSEKKIYPSNHSIKNRLLERDKLWCQQPETLKVRGNREICTKQNMAKSTDPLLVFSPRIKSGCEKIPCQTKQSDAYPM